MLLRLEDLFDKVAFFSEKQDAFDHHSALVTLFEILDVTSRTDMKSDLLQELERQKQALEILRGSPKISEGALNQVLGNIQAASQGMLNMPGKIGEHLRDNEWLMSIKQRVGIPGGACEFDLPSYHYWLHLDPATRRSDLNEWWRPCCRSKGVSALFCTCCETVEKSSGTRLIAAYFSRWGRGGWPICCPSK